MRSIECKGWIKTPSRFISFISLICDCSFMFLILYGLFESEYISFGVTLSITVGIASLIGFESELVWCTDCTFWNLSLCICGLFESELVLMTTLTLTGFISSYWTSSSLSICGFWRKSFKNWIVLFTYTASPAKPRLIQNAIW